MTARLATIVPRLLGILIVLLYAWLTWCLSLILLSFRSGPLVSVGLDMRGFLAASGNVARPEIAHEVAARLKGTASHVGKRR